MTPEAADYLNKARDDLNDAGKIAAIELAPTNKYLASIKGYDLPSSFFERLDSGAWEEKTRKDKIVQHAFTEDDFDPQFLLLSDIKRNVKIRIPTQGGMLQWSLNEKFNNCQYEYCWGDVWHATMRR